ncbi:MAG: hypothetical protein ACHQXL_07390 [Candidatus Limnocylindrales bacterium]
MPRRSAAGQTQGRIRPALRAATRGQRVEPVTPGLAHRLALVVYAAITFVGSTLTRSAAVAPAGLGVVAVLFLGILTIIPAIGPYLPTGLGAPARALALGEVSVDVLRSVLASVLLIAGLLAIAWLAFRRYEL